MLSTFVFLPFNLAKTERKTLKFSLKINAVENTPDIKLLLNCAKSDQLNQRYVIKLKIDISYIQSLGEKIVKLETFLDFSNDFLRLSLWLRY